MLDSKLLNKVNEVETQTGQSLICLLNLKPLNQFTNLNLSHAQVRFLL